MSLVWPLKTLNIRTINRRLQLLTIVDELFGTLRNPQSIGHFEVAWETGSRVLLNCIVGLFWRRATVCAVIKEKIFVYS